MYSKLLIYTVQVNEYERIDIANSIIVLALYFLDSLKKSKAWQHLVRAETKNVPGKSK